MFWIGVDVGGTFTDAIAYDDRTRSISYAKALSTPDDPARGVLDAVDALKADLTRVGRFVHGITIGTNAILERQGARIWMLTTQGFRDVLEIGRTNRPILYDIKTLKAPPLVARTRVIEVNERVMFDGTVRVPLDEDELRAAIRSIPTEGSDALAICFLHSYANPAHERKAAAIAREIRPDLFVCASSDVLPQYREYERFSTTALNAYVGPRTARYLTRLETALVERGYRHQLLITTSNGGVSTVARAKRLPVSTVLSGPAAGVAASVELGKRLGIENFITCDMGGTSTDVCLVERLQLPLTNEQQIGDHANRTPQIEINAVGAGGGSIAWLDDGDILMVGPQSAGADPAPACYGRGGLEPTVTDANLVLNRLSPESRLAGTIALDSTAALTAIGRLAARLRMKLSEHSLAEGIIRIAVARMVSAIKQISITKGFDPRDFALVAYGGAGPMHATFIAEELEIANVIVPVAPGNFCAYGALLSDIRQDFVWTRPVQTRTAGIGEIERILLELETKGRENLIREGAAPTEIRTVRTLGMRYLGQSWELNVTLPDALSSVADIESAFEEIHDRRFGHRSGGVTEIVSFRVAAIGIVSKPTLALPEITARPTSMANRPVYFGDRFHKSLVYRRSDLPPGFQSLGPTVIEESGSTTIVPPGWSASVLRDGALNLKRDRK